ncbi:helix-turn-helix domain-containing protein [Neptunomonas marina]|uniref:DNA-binding protein n=1 Tax=Neptunomonas marina TaxID=1815562 RepID=A0A437QB10_9GAMM|nr:helix-turn-helix domain-containing protein [Neptunomonas marina]RVU31744.1 DNA-binding protein [Neptunomonas marina]
MPNDAYFASGAINKALNPPAIHLILPEEELQKGFTLYRGSGGNVSSLFSVTPTGANTKIIKESHNNLASTVNDITAAFALTKEELADVLKVQSRKTLYNWIKGEVTPRKTAMQRVFNLMTLVKAWQHAGLELTKEQLHQPVVNNLSIFQLLIEAEIDKDLVLFAGSRLQLQAQPTPALADPFA